MAGPGTHRRRLLPALLTLAVMTATARADEPVRLGLLPAAEPKPLTLAADEVYSWTEADEQVILLKGKALVEQGVVNARANRIVVWVDSAAKRRTGAYRVRVVAEGSAVVENGEKEASGSVASFELSTRPDPAPRPGVRVVLQAQGTDPFFRRALALKPVTPTIQQTAAASPPRPAGPAVTPTQAPPVAPPVDWPSEAPATRPPLTGVPSDPLPTVPVPTPDVPRAMPAPPPEAATPAGPPRTLTIAPRSATPYNVKGFRGPNGEQVGVFSGGIILLVRNVQHFDVLDVEADRLVVWQKGEGNGAIDRMKSTGTTTADDVEIYLDGNVQLRRAGGKDRQDQQVLRAEQLYYDVRRNAAVAVQAELEMYRPGMPQPLFLRAGQFLQLSPTRFQAFGAELFSSKLPSDPGLKVTLARAELEQKSIERRGLFGQPILDRRTGKPQTYPETLIRGENVVAQLEGLPVFYLPAVRGNAADPLGPLQSVGFKQDRIFGTQVYTTFDVWNLLNRDPLPGTRWTLDADYLSRRGPALGSNYEYKGLDLFGLAGPYSGDIRLYGIYDDATDILGGGRGEGDDHPEWRGRAFWRHAQKVFDDITLQSQLSLLSDKNFLEQYYKTEFDTDLNQETFVYAKYQRDTASATLLVKPNVRRWVTEDVWLPKVEGRLLGQSFFDWFTYNLRASGGYADLHVTNEPPFPVPAQQFTDRDVETGRLNLNQELSLPFYLGPVKLVPYGVLDLTYYTRDLNGDANGRLYGGGGVRGSVPFSRLYPDVRSDLFNLSGLNHKILLSGNYFIADSSDSFVNFPQLDRLNDDATDQAIRDITPLQPALNPAKGLALATSPIFNPQLYAIRRLVDNRVDTLDTIEVLQADLRQRWQTKRGYPGQEHTIDYVTLDLSASYFPHPDRDNFGKDVAFLEYDAVWNVGDRTALVSSGWFDPYRDGARVATFGAFLNRPDRTNFFVGYRHIDPIDSRALTAAATYLFSPKYAMTASMTYDFGINQALSNSLVITRIGTDLTMSVGVNYNALLNNFGFTFEVVPNIVAASRRPGAPGGVFGGRGATR